MEVESRAEVVKGPYRVVVYHNLGHWETEWDYGDGDITFEVGEETVVIGTQVLYPDGTLAGCVHHGMMLTGKTETVNVKMDYIERAIAQIERDEALIWEAMHGGEESVGEGGRLGGSDPDGTGDQSEASTSEQSDADVQTGQLHDGDGGDA